MAFAVPIFPEYLSYTGEEDADGLDLERQSIIIGRRQKRDGATKSRAPMLGDTERSQSAPNIGHRIKKSQQTTKFGATGETDVAKILRKKQAREVSSRIEKAKSVDEGSPPVAAAESSVDAANLKENDGEEASSVPEPKAEVKVHKRPSRGESVLVLLRRLSSGRMQMTKPAPTQKSDDTTV